MMISCVGFRIEIGIVSAHQESEGGEQWFGVSRVICSLGISHSILFVSFLKGKALQSRGLQ